MKGLLFVFLIFVIASHSLSARITPIAEYGGGGSTFDVSKYGAVGDGNTDDTEAFLKAWNDVCTSQDDPTLIIPKNKTFFLQPLRFQGPCKSATVKVELSGTIIAPKNMEDWKWAEDKETAWIRFEGINGLVVNGEGQINGQGAPWWEKYPNDESKRPSATKFIGCEGLTISNLTHYDSPKNHMSISSCKEVSISNLKMIAPEDSPNTDGIDIADSSNVIIKDSTFTTGDDCIAINTGSSFINITGVFCGPGHGISVGSLGKNGEQAKVEEVYVTNCTFTKTSNGARIKTWEGGNGYARNITYEDIEFIEVQNPIIIDQSYNPNIFEDVGKGVVVSDVTFRDLRGTSIEDPIQLKCEATISCINIELDNINITRIDKEKSHTL
ncbi:probable polygalacturonase At3g15720 [Vicia villosa]|uniref:probable polygalacturonase At3g15720 n=1 Tax=Vicia villosa TaxID=3911 RepID=UPI00273B0DF1|nr:probable polygalacturonase At3g15720 [Vicia villosa]